MGLERCGRWVVISKRQSVARSILAVTAGLGVGHVQWPCYFNDAEPLAGQFLPRGRADPAVQGAAIVVPNERTHR